MDICFSKTIHPAVACDTSDICSFFELIDGLWIGDNHHHDHSLHRLCTLMRKMRARSYIQEDLFLDGRNGSELIPDIETERFLFNELLEEKSDAEKRCGGRVSLSAVRLSFFWCDAARATRGDCNDDHFIGYGVLVTLQLPDGNSRTYLFESVVRPPSITIDPVKLRVVPPTNYFVHNSRDCRTCVGTREFAFKGSFFTQQNNLINTCAHAALRMALNSAPVPLEGLRGVIKLTNRRINDILGIHFDGPEQMVGEYEGDAPGLKESLRRVTYKDIIKVINQLGGECTHAIFPDRKNESKIEYDQFIYPLVESGLPVIIGVQGRKELDGVERERWEDLFVSHVMPVIGHTLNTDRWVESRCGYRTYHLHKKYFTASEWCDHFIINDDNYGMYITLPADIVRFSNEPFSECNSSNKADSVDSHAEGRTVGSVPMKSQKMYVSCAIGIIPSEMNIEGYKAEQKVIQYLPKLIETIHKMPPTETMPIWFERMKALCLDEEHFVCRTFLCAKDDYRDSLEKILKQNNDFRSIDLDAWFEKIPHYLWVSEISHPHLYTGNQTKLGDVVVSAVVNPHKVSSKKDIDEALDVLFAWGPGFFYRAKSELLHEWPIQSHVPLMRKTEISPLEYPQPIL